MKVEKAIVSPTASYFSPCPKKALVDQKYVSTIRGAKKASQVHVFFSWLKEKISQFTAWICSWLYAEEKKKEDPYTKIDTGRSIRYRIDEENEVRLGPRIARFEDISFQDKERLQELDEMLEWILEKEKIDFVSTQNLYHAWLLWKAGLSTEGEISCQLDGQKPMDRFLTPILKEACAKTLDEKGKKALIAIEEKILNAIFDEAINTSQGRAEQRAAAQFLAVNQKLDNNIDLDSLFRNASVNDYQKNALHALKKELTKNPQPAQKAGEFSLALADLFSLCKSLGKEMDRKNAFAHSQIQFSLPS